MNNPVFIDCYGDLADRFSPKMHSFLPHLKVYYGKPKNEKEIIERIGNHRNVIVYMAYLSKNVLHSCKNLKSIAYLSTGINIGINGASIKSIIPPTI